MAKQPVIVCLAIVAALIAFSACATPQLLRPGELAPVAAQVAADQRVATWQRAIAVLLTEGYVPQVLNEAACYISAKQRDDITEGAVAGTLAIVTVSPEGVVRVEVSGTGVYRSASDLAHDLDAIQRRLIQEIMTPSTRPST